MIRGLIVAVILLLSGAAKGDADPEAFSQPLSGLSDHDRATIHLGNSLFRKSWRPAPSDTTSSDGLGPLYNARSCSDCHFRDGRGRPPETENDPAPGLILRLSPPDPVYGHQLQTRAISGHQPEGQPTITYREQTVRLADGEEVRLRKPVYAITGEPYGPLAGQSRLSPRLAPPVFGLGLLEAVPDDAILALADPHDRNRDGISGRARFVHSRASGEVRPGRFGWKSEQATIADQNASALSNDIGIGNALFPDLWGDCSPTQATCRAGPHGGSARHGGLEVSDKVLRHLTFYLQGLAPPAPRGQADDLIQTGRRIFTETGCAACHRPSFTTASTPALSALADREIHPYTDLLLHDMGDGLAAGDRWAREWRTPPLWGIGLTKSVSGYEFYLHDGRARTLAEAILWHGGEAAPARDKFRNLPKPDRSALLHFLRSL